MVECISANYPGDRRFIIATGDHTFSTGTTAKVVFALVATNPDTLNSCPGANFDNIKAVADTAWNRYWGQQQLSVNSHTQNRKKVSTYPNPAQEVINIAINNAEPTEIRIIDALGRVLIPKTHISIGKAIVDIAMLPAGMYHLTYSVDKERHSATFIKE